jgi:hypothetical protein
MVINGRKAYYDIVVDPNADSTQSAAENAAFLEWVECLEDNIIRSLHHHGKVWFRDPLSEDDIRTLFTSPLKPFKGGKQFSIRINVLPGKVRTTQFNCTVFDEKENSVQVDYVTATHNIISIVEVLGVRFTSNSFQLELASKQIAIIVPKPVFQTCIIKKDVNIAATANAMQHAKTTGTNVNTNMNTNTNANTPPALPVSAHVPVTTMSSVDDIHIDNTAPSVHIKDPLEVFYALYKAARKRAREAKHASIAAYLDAKNIKNTYNLQLIEDDSDDSDNCSDSDSDSDSDSGAPNSDDTESGDNENAGDNVCNVDDDDSDANDDEKKLPPINISGDSIDLSISDYDALG